MCTLVVAHAAVRGFPLVLAHDRDELVTRPWSAPARHADAPHVLAPRDELAGGTWLGVNDSGLVVAVTNRFGARTEEPLPSRGQLATYALASSSAAAALASVRSHLGSERYHGFNLVIADRREVFVVSREAGVADEIRLAPGVHLITSLEHLNPPALADVRDGLAARAAAGAEAFGVALRALLATNEPHGSGYTVCKHLGAYGTVSGAIVWLGAEGRVRFEFAPGPPCTTAFADVVA